MFKNINELMDSRCSHLKFDKKLYDQLHAFRIGWMQKSDIYVEFLGGNSLGVQPIRFSTRDDEELMVDIFQLDIANLKTDITHVKGISTKWKTACNPIYQTLGYVMHRFTASNDIGKYKELAIQEAHLIFSYKVIGSRIAHFFKFNADPYVAKTVYEKLSNKYLIKRMNNWQEVFEYRTKDVLPHGLHYKRVKDYSTDDSVRLLNDTHGRIQELVKNIYVVMLDVIESKSKINSTTLIESNDEGGESTVAITDRPDKYINYIRSIITNSNSFIDDDLLYLLSSIVPHIDIAKLKDTLVYIANEVKIQPESKNDFIFIAITKTIEYNRTKGIMSDYRSQILDMITNVKGYWSSSSVKDPEVKYIKKYLFNLSKKALDKKTKFLLVTNSIGVLLYIFLRAVAKQ